MLTGIDVLRLTGDASARFDFTNPNDQLELLQWAAACGFGSSVILRAKLINLKLSDGKELALGPEIVIQTFLSVLDRELDRERAGKRWDKVRELFS